MLTKALLSLVCLTLGTAVCAQTTYTLGYSSVSGASLTFDPTNDRFQFNSAAEDIDFVIGSSSGNTLNGVRGRINGTFQVGSPLTSTPVSGFGTFDSGPVTGAASIALVDASGISLDGTILSSTGSITTFVLADGSQTTGWLSPSTIQWSSSYSGSNAQLQAFQGKFATASLTFIFPGSYPLMTLLSQPSIPFAYSGGMTVADTEIIPEPSTYALGAGLLALGAVMWRRRRQGG